MKTDKMKLVILQNEFDDNHLYWKKACENKDIDAEIIELTKNDWLNKIVDSGSDGFLSCPSGRESLFKTLYDERIYIVDKVMNRFVYPNYNEICIHENKRFFSYWLKANRIPHPKTDVFYGKKEALEFVKTAPLPLVGKFNIGASGKGVKIIRNRSAVCSYIDDAFSAGIRQNWGPNLRMGGYKNRMKELIKDPSRIFKRLKVYGKVFRELQKGFILLQEYIPHDFEWRVVRIGDSYFGHQKVKSGDKASGTKGIDYVSPPDELLNFARNLCERFGFNSMAIDLFEDGKGGYLVNEMQCIFGHVQSYICEKNGKPGRYIFKNTNWIFEEGLFNSNLSYDLRLDNVLILLKSH